MMEEVFQEWFKERVQLLMDGEPLPPLPFLPPDDSEHTPADTVREV